MCLISYTALVDSGSTPAVRLNLSISDRKPVESAKECCSGKAWPAGDGFGVGGCDGSGVKSTFSGVVIFVATALK